MTLSTSPKRKLGSGYYMENSTMGKSKLMPGAKSRKSWAHGSLQAERSCSEDVQGKGLSSGIFRGLNTDRSPGDQCGDERLQSQ